MARVRLLVGPRRGRFPWSNCVLVEAPRGRILVDTGCCDAVESVGPVDYVVYTHYHPDHVRCLGSVPGSPRILAPAQEEPYSGAGLRELAARFAPGVWRDWVRMAEELLGIKGAPAADGYYEPGETLRLAGVELETFHAPGHLLSHTIILLPDGTLYLSDIDLTGFGPWYGNPESDPGQFLADISMAKALLEEGAASRAATSHLDEVLNAAEALKALSDFEEKLWDTARRVVEELARAGRPLTPRELAGRGIIYPRYLQGYEAVMRYFEETMIAKLLGLLQARGAVKRASKGYTLTRRDLNP